MEKEIKSIKSIWIDVSKNTLDICFISEKLEVLKQFKIENNFLWISKFLEENFKLEDLKNLKENKDSSNSSNSSNIQNISVILESTSTYHILASFLFKELWFKVKVLNPLVSNKYLKSSVRKCKTDKIDSRKIAEIWVLEKDLEDFIETRENFILKKKISLLSFLQKQLQTLKASFNKAKEDFKNLWFDKKEENKKYFLTLESSIKDLNKSIKELEKEIQTMCDEIDWWKYKKNNETISNIKWVSKRSSSILLSFIWDKNFKSKEALTAYFWLDVSTKQSWTSVRWNWSISKRWNNIVRKILFQVAWWLYMFDDNFKRLYESHKSKWRHYFEILIILSRKFLHMLYWCLKSGLEFNSAKIVIPNN